MTFRTIRITLLAGAACASGTLLASDLETRFARSADAVVLAETCETLGFGVDREGIAALAVDVQGDAVSGGMSAEQAKLRMKAEIEAEFQRRDEHFARASIMSHARENVERFNRLQFKRCEKLANHAMTAPYFRAPQT